jgi:hypothetical protein
MLSFTTGYRRVTERDLRKDMRLHYPILSVRIGDLLCETVDWSLGGMRVANYTGCSQVGDTVELVVEVSDGGGDWQMRCQARVVRVSALKGEIALQFEELGPKIFDFLEHCWSRHSKRPHST